MNIPLILSSLLGFGFCGPAIIPIQEDGEVAVNHVAIETSPGVYEVEQLMETDVAVQVSASEIVYHFFTQANPESGIDVNNANFAALESAGFSPNRQSVFIVHGWKGDNISEFNNAMRRAYLARQDVNLFMVDWSPIADRLYVIARNSGVRVGEITADFIKSLVDVFGLRLSDVLFVGFSLGAHVAGNAGAALNGEVGTIIGLEPAGPLFNVDNINDRLDPTDAKHVHVIHTSELVGFSHPSGHVDCYPNGGSSQPGCGVDIFRTCAHDRSHRYFAEALLSDVNGFVALQCPSYSDFTRGRCRSNISTRMGDVLNRSVSGTFYLDTNSRAPFARG